MTQTSQLAPQLAFALQDWATLFFHYLSLSLLAVGGAITTASDMHRFLVVEQHWLTDAQFNASIAIAQAAPGPNVLFIALMGWNVGLNAGGMLMTTSNNGMAESRFSLSGLCIFFCW